MPITIEERYRLIFENYRFASEYRIKLITGWVAIYTALAAAFGWTYQNAKTISWLLPLVGILITVFMWIADRRHRPAIGRSKTVGANIEVDQSAGIPENQRYFSDLTNGVSHSLIIDIFSVLIIICLGVATVFLICNRC